MSSARVCTSLLLTLVFVAGCRNRSDVNTSIPKGGASKSWQNPFLRSEPLASVPNVAGPLFLRRKPSETGIDFVIPIDTQHPLKRLYAGSFFCGGVAIGDVDNDERPDLFVVSGPRQNGLFRQIGDFQFQDISAQAGIGGGESWGTGAAMVDIDNDKDLDIYVCNYDAPNQLYVNQGNGRFIESASAFGLNIVDCSVLPAFCDYDRDGDLDCFLLTNRFYRAGGFPADMKIRLKNGEPTIPEEYHRYYRVRRSGRKTGELQRVGRRDRLLRNDGGSSFTDVSLSSGISEEPGYGLSASWCDFDGDGWHDLYVGNDYHDPDRLYQNNRDGTFTDVISQRVPHSTWFSMGADVGDINNDGLFDLLSVDMSATTHYGQKTTMGEMGSLFKQLENAQPPQYMRNALLVNSGTNRFFEMAYLSGLANSDWSWAARLADFDNDGLVDAYITNGMTRNMIDADHSFSLADQIGRTKWDLYEQLPSLPQQNRAYRNHGDFTFQDVSRDWGLDHEGMSFAAATGDLDLDGDLDLVVANLNEPISIYQNRSSTGNRVLIRLVGKKSNHWGIGAVVRMETDSQRFVRQLMPSTGYLTSSQPLLHFGLGDEKLIRRLTVHWPTGHEQSFENLPVGHFFTIDECESEQNEKSDSPTRTIYAPSNALSMVRHVERPFDDFARQPLLPNKLSQLGPGMAVGDVDGDGYEDFFFSGAAGQSGMLVRRNGPEQFSPPNMTPFAADANSEDMSPLFFDADQDGDLDLYVASGGVECEPKSPVLRDRLYLNDGQGGFVKAASDALPVVHDSGGPVAACDFDRDGDLDLFVGGRVLPGRYPLTPKSRLLRNEGGRFQDVTQQIAPDLLHTGMVTGALWSDADDDGWLDLLVTQEWGPIKLFRNRKGQFEDQTIQAGLNQLLGWWNGIAARDLDGDLDMDYVVTNFGLNTKYHASQDSPTLLFCGDFEGTRRLRIVEAEYEGATLYPVRGKSCSSHAMPFLRNKFATYKGFASASLEEIYSNERLAQARRFAATTLSSGALINNGKGQFKFQPLPNLAQVSPGFGVVLSEFNGDGFADAYVAQNFFSPQIETGRMDGGLSVLLYGKGDGTFEAIWPHESGLIVSGDAKSLVVTDLNDDGRPDFVVGVNDDHPQAFIQQGTKDHTLLSVRLMGRPGNRHAIGARVTLSSSDGHSQTAEIAAGSGYMSQSTSVLTFGRPQASDSELRIRWPDGTSSKHRVPAQEQQTTIEILHSR